MLFNQDTLFLHIPKTAGKSVSAYLAHNLPKPVFGLVSAGQVQEIGLGEPDGVHLEIGESHQNLRGARRDLKAYDRTLDSFERIVVVVRNPYELAVSNYFFLRNSYEQHPHVRGLPNFQLAASSTFRAFYENARRINFRAWVELEEEVDPAQIRVIRFEQLRQDLRGLLDEMGVQEDYELPHLNSSKRLPVSEMITADAKPIIDDYYDTLFEIGGYEKDLSRLS